MQAERTAALSGTLDVTQAAQLLETHRNWVYKHLDDLGGYRIGSGRSARVVFDRAPLEAIGRLLTDTPLPSPDEWAISPEGATV